jgi:hypothetical protein
MATAKNKSKLVPLKKIEGKPGLYTFGDFDRDPKSEKRIVDKIVREARKMRAQAFPRNGS